MKLRTEDFRFPWMGSLLALAFVAGCSAQPPAVAGGSGGAGSSPSTPKAAIAKLAPTAGSEVTGSFDFIQRGEVLVIQGEVSGLAPSSVHGFHVHEKGDCSSPDGMSAGAHFNPGGQAHGNPDAGPHHAGDLSNLASDGNGVAVVKSESRVLSIDGSAAIVGRALIVHAGPDDYTTQPTGNSGARLACGVIAAAPGS